MYGIYLFLFQGCDRQGGDGDTDGTCILDLKHKKKIDRDYTYFSIANAYASAPVLEPFMEAAGWPKEVQSHIVSMAIFSQDLIVEYQ